MKTLKTWIARLLIFLILIFPFISKGFVVPKNPSGSELGKAIGENIINWILFWMELVEGIVRTFQKVINSKAPGL